MDAEPRFLTLCRRLMEQPAIAYHEELVIQHVEAICAENGLTCESDVYGNRIVTLNTAGAQPPLALVAHVDHPGFEIIRSIGPGLWEARFLGGVGPDYFQPGVPLRLHPGDIPARLGRKLLEAGHYEIQGDSPESDPVLPQFGVWHLEGFRVLGDRIHGRACDDLVGVAAILETLIRLKASNAPVHVQGLITRAEEVGFHGSLLLAESQRISKEAWVISLETSRELPPVSMGCGVILRVGDRASVFDSRFSRALGEVGIAIHTQDSAFTLQRALMSGGTCEGTAFQEHGYRVAALCVALGNYHNCGPQTRIEEEFVSVADALGMVRLLEETARCFNELPTLAGKLADRLTGYTREARLRLDPKS